MSICPDKIVFSEYVDGELPKPWSEKLKTHIDECSSCNSSYCAYKKISDSMKLAGQEATETFDYNASFEKLKVKLNQRLAEKKLDVSDNLSEKPFWLKSIKLPIPALAVAMLLFIFLPAFVFFASSTKNVTNQPYMYPVMYSNQKTIRSSELTKSQINFNSGVTGFLRFYMPNKDKQGAYRVLDVPATIELQQYEEFLKNYADVEEFEPFDAINNLETKAPKN